MVNLKIKEPAEGNLMPSLKAKNWDKSKIKNLEKMSENTGNNFSETKTISINPVQKEKVSSTKKKKKTSTVQNATQKEKKKLPKIIIVTYNKKGDAEYREYICAELNLHENTHTTLSGSYPTSRKDVVDVSIDAQVVEVN